MGEGQLTWLSYATFIEALVGVNLFPIAIYSITPHHYSPCEVRDFAQGDLIGA